MNRLQATLFTPLRQRDLDPASFQQAATTFPGTLRALHAHICAAGVFEDRGEIELASEEIAAAEACYNDFSINLPALLHNSFIYHHAIYRRDAVAARLWWDRMQTKKIERKNVDYYMSDSSLAWIEARGTYAEQAWILANVEARQLPSFGCYQFDRDRVALLRDRIDGPASKSLPIADCAASATQPESIPSAPTSDRKPLLVVAGISAVLLAGVMAAPTIPFSALVWHCRHGNSTQIAGYRVHVPLRWETHLHQYRGVDDTWLIRTDSSDTGLARISMSSPSGYRYDAPSVSDQQMLDETRRAIEEHARDGQRLVGCSRNSKSQRLFALLPKDELRRPRKRTLR